MSQEGAAHASARMHNRCNSCLFSKCKHDQERAWNVPFVSAPAPAPDPDVGSVRARVGLMTGS